MQQAATTRWLARKLLRFFAAPEPGAEVIAEGAEVLDRTQLNIKWFLRELFLSKYFYSDACLRQRIASPAEYVVGTLRTLGAVFPATALTGHLSAMGQELLAPPNVKGWDGERKWINSSTWAARLAFAREVSALGEDGEFGRHLGLEKIVPADVKDPGRVVDRLADVLLRGDLTPESRRSLADFLVTGEDGQKPESFREDEDFRREKTRGVLAIVLGLPEYHAC